MTVRNLRYFLFAALTFSFACLLGAMLLAAARALAATEAAPPALLSQTGLYADITRGVIAADHRFYSPQYPLWSDGASKRRWIYLPEGTAIDASVADRWEFPAGTRLFKEFAFGRAIETRMLERLADGSWSFAAYIWDEDGREARLAPSRGQRGLLEVQPGVSWDVPGRYDCLACHGDAAAPVLGFSLLQLSPDRDPLAPHAEPTDGVLLGDLIGQGHIRGLVGASPDWPAIRAASARERALRGYLHANCGGCHNATGSLRDLGLRLDRATAADLLDPRVAERIATRAPARQMPPLGTQLVDAEAVALLASWLDERAPQISRNR